MKKVVLPLFVMLCTSVASANWQWVLVDDYNGHRTDHCDANIDLQCTDGERCWVNISSSKCRGVRLYDNVSEWNGRFYESSETVYADLRGSYPYYHTDYGQLWVEKSRFRYETNGWNWGEGYPYYVPLFLYDKLYGNPYDRVFLRFTHK